MLHANQSTQIHLDTLSNLNKNTGHRLHDSSVGGAPPPDLQGSDTEPTRQLKGSNAHARRRPSKGSGPPSRASAPGSSSHEESPNGPPIRQQSPHRHLDQRLDGNPLRESTSEAQPRQKEIPGERNPPTPLPPANPGGGPGVRRETTASPSCPDGTPNGSERRGIPLRIGIPERPSSKTPIKPKIKRKPLEPPQEFSKPGTSHFCGPSQNLDKI